MEYSEYKTFEDIRDMFVSEYNKGNIVDGSGYELSNGNRYVELRDVIFRVTGNIFDCIFQGAINGLWYILNYEPVYYEQYQNVLNRLLKNSKTRQYVNDLTLNKQKMSWWPFIKIMNCNFVN